MHLNIKSDEAHKLASRLAELTGESLTTAVTRALRERLDSERRRRQRGPEVSERLLEIGRRFGELPDAKAPSETTDGPDFDEHGVPR